MLIRVSGYNSGVKEYLEEGVKNGRDFTREELDERVILHGDLDLTEMIYQQIPDKAQDRYITLTLSFREDEVPFETLHAITQEMRQFLMYGYEDEEYNFYAEAHLPKIKEVVDKKTGDMIVRKPHIHVVIPKKNLFSGKFFDPVGSNFGQSVEYLEAFQEYINQKYELASPREHIRVDLTNVADVLSRYKGDDFRSKNQDFKKQLVADVIEGNITSRADFYQHVSTFGETKIRNAGRENEYIAVKLPGDAKFTNLKETIFQDDFIVRREVKKPPLDKKVIRDRLQSWPQRAKEIKYVSKATSKFRQFYKAATPEEKINLLAQRQADFYNKYRGAHELHPAEWQRDHQRSLAEVETGGVARAADGLQGVPGGDVATDRNGGEALRAVLLPGDAHLHLGQQEPGRGAGLRSDLSTRGRGGRNAGQHHFDKFTAIPGVPNFAESVGRRGYQLRDGLGGGDAGELSIPVYARDPHRIAGMADIAKRGERLFGRRAPPATSNAVALIRRIMPKTDRNASFVAAYFLRQHEVNQILPEHRREIRAVDTLFFDARRVVSCDDRLTRNEKAQYISILTFERLKAHHAIRYPDSPFEQESPEMGSADIRKLIKAARVPDNSISGAQEEDKDILPARERFSRLIKNVNEHMAETRRRNGLRDISPNDLYTKRARLSKNVHYLDKKTDRTLFVDTGNAIAVRKNGMTGSSVLVALELAKQKFGSSLTIKGSQKFKDQVIEVAAKNNLDVHFTDKEMNRKFEERKAELAIEKEGQRIEPAASPAMKPAESREEFQTAFKGIEDRYQDLINRAENLTADEMIAEVGEINHDFNQLCERYQDTFNDNASGELTHKSQALQQQINDIIERKKREEERDNGQAPLSKVPAFIGELLEHGAAPYKFKPDLNKPEDKRDDSYFVKLRTPDGKTSTLWGVGLENAVSGLRQGERVKLEDKGVTDVKWREEQQDGSYVEKSGQRRTWEGTPLDRERDEDQATTERQPLEHEPDPDEPEYDL